MLPGIRSARLLWIFLLICTFLVFDNERAGAEEALASWYGPGFEGRPTAGGEPYDPNGYTAAHKTMPLGTKLMVSYGGRSIPVTINDRGPYAGERELDLSQAAARELGLMQAGVDVVEWSYADSREPELPQGAAQEQVLPREQVLPQAAREPGLKPADVEPGPVGGYKASYPDNPRSYPPVRASEANGGGYVVQPGDTLSQIATRLGVSVDDLARYNGIVDPDLVYSGQALYFPVLEENPVGGGEHTTTGDAGAQGPSGIPASDSGELQIPGETTIPNGVGIGGGGNPGAMPGG